MDGVSQFHPAWIPSIHKLANFGPGIMLVLLGCLFSLQLFSWAAPFVLAFCQKRFSSWSSQEIPYTFSGVTFAFSAFGLVGFG